MLHVRFCTFDSMAISKHALVEDPTDHPCADSAALCQEQRYAARSTLHVDSMAVKYACAR